MTGTGFRDTEHHEVLERSDGKRVFYTYVERVGGGESIEMLAGRYLPRGSLLRSRRSKGRHDWRILMRSDESVGLLYEALGSNLRSELPFHMGHLRDADRWGYDSLGTVSLDSDQRTALRAAARHGYIPGDERDHARRTGVGPGRATVDALVPTATRRKQLVTEYLSRV